MEAGFGVTVSEVAVSAVTVRDAWAEMPPEVAVMVVVPAETPRANPLVREVSPMVANAVVDELQLTRPVIVCVVLSL